MLALTSPRRPFVLALVAATAFYALAYPHTWVSTRAERPAPEPGLAFGKATMNQKSAQEMLVAIVHRREVAERFLNRLAPLAPQWTLAGDELSIELDSAHWKRLAPADRTAWMKTVASDPALKDLGCHLVQFYVGDRRVARFQR